MQKKERLERDGIALRDAAMNGLKRRSCDEEYGQSQMTPKRRNICDVVGNFCEQSKEKNKVMADFESEKLKLEKTRLEFEMSRASEDRNLREKEISSKERMFFAELQERRENSQRQHDLLMRLLQDKM